MASTRDRILDCALSKFNSEGLPSVGLRDIAEELGLSPGNVTYYFAKKEDLVRELSGQLAELNNQSLNTSDVASFSDFLGAIRDALHNHWRYRFLSASYVQVMTEYATVAESYAVVEVGRRTRLLGNLRALQRAGCLREDLSELDLDQVTHGLALMARFAAPDRVVRQQAWNQSFSEEHYIALMARLLTSVATDSGRRELERWQNACLP